MEKSTFEKVKQRIRQHGQTYKIDELCLDEINIGEFTPELAKLVQKCINLDYLSLNSCNLKSLSQLPHFPKLALLQLNNNQIQDNHLSSLTQYPLLNHLVLSQNKIKAIQSLKNLQPCSQLMKINITQNPAHQGQEFITQVFSILPQVQFVNGYNKNGNKEEIESDSQDYSHGSEDSEDQESQEELQNQSPSKIKKK